VILLLLSGYACKQRTICENVLQELPHEIPSANLIPGGSQNEEDKDGSD
jgi:hypothetical protein